MTYTELVIPYALDRLSQAAFNARIERFKHRPNTLRGTSVFTVHYDNRKLKPVSGPDGSVIPMKLPNEDIRAILGEEVKAGTFAPNRITGAEKYRPGVYDVYVLGALHQLYPHGHNNIILSLAHPPNALPYLAEMNSVIGGTHEITGLDGKRIKYRISAIVPFDECAGGVLYGLHQKPFLYNTHELKDGDQILVLDIGGRISSLYPAVIKRAGRESPAEPYILWESGEAFHHGIQDVEDGLRAIIPSMYPGIFKGPIPAGIIESIMANNGLFDYGRKQYDFSEALLQATAPLLNVIESTYIEKMGRWPEAKLVLGTGGGSARLSNILQVEIFQPDIHPFVLATEPKRIHLANGLGGVLGLPDWAKRQQAAIDKLVAKYGPAGFTVMDAGNSQNKSFLL